MITAVTNRDITGLLYTLQKKQQQLQGAHDVSLCGQQYSSIFTYPYGKFPTSPNLTPCYCKSRVRGLMNVYTL